MQRMLATGLLILALLVTILIAGPTACNKIRSMGAQGRLQQGQTEALSNSAGDAIAAQGAAAARERASEELTRTNEEEIRNAKGADAQVDPAVRDAGMRSLCRRAAYRDSERCRLLAAGAAGVEGRR